LIFMLRLNSALVALAGAFTGTYAPFQAIHLQPHAGGVLVASSDHGRVSALAFDRQGRADESCDLLASSELLRSCSGIKTAERELSLEGDTLSVTTYRKKAAHEVKTFPLQRASAPFPPLDQAVAACVRHWGAAPTLSRTAGRYDSAYLEKALKAAGHLCDSLVLSSFDGGPLRLQSDTLELVILVMPQTAAPIPPLPDWLERFAADASTPLPGSPPAACQGVQSR